MLLRGVTGDSCRGTHDRAPGDRPRARRGAGRARSCPTARPSGGCWSSSIRTRPRSSDRLKNLVVYALQSRYSVEAIDTEKRDHATQITPRGRAARATTWWWRSAATAPSTRPPTGWSAPTPRSRAFRAVPPTSGPRTLGIPNDVVDATEHLLRMADEFQPRRVDLGRVERAPLRVLRPGSASTRASWSAWTPIRGARRASAPGTTPTPRSRSSTAATSSARRGCA